MEGCKGNALSYYTSTCCSGNQVPCSGGTNCRNGKDFYVYKSYSELCFSANILDCSNIGKKYDAKNHLYYHHDKKATECQDECLKKFWGTGWDHESGKDATYDTCDDPDDCDSSKRDNNDQPTRDYKDGYEKGDCRCYGDGQKSAGIYSVRYWNSY